MSRDGEATPAIGGLLLGRRLVLHVALKPRFMARHELLRFCLLIGSENVENLRMNFRLLDNEFAYGLRLL